MKKLQQQVTMLCMQQQQMIDKVAKLQVEAESITGIIHPIHQRVRQAVEAAWIVMSEHLHSDLVENLEKVEEDVRRETEETLKIFEYFQDLLCLSSHIFFYFIQVFQKVRTEALLWYNPCFFHYSPHHLMYSLDNVFNPLFFGL